MKKLTCQGLLCLFLLCFQQHTTAQDKKMLDSLLNALSSSAEDTNKMELLDIISFEYAGNSFEKALHYANLELDLAKKLNYKLGEASALSAIGTAHHYKGNFSVALEYFMKSLKLKEEIGDKMLIIKSYNNIASIYNTQGDYDKALEYFFKILENKDIDNNENRGNTYNNIGIAYKNKKKFQKAIEYHMKGLEARRMAGLPKAIAASHNNIGVTYLDMKQYDKAIMSFKEALALRIPLNDLSGISATNINIGKTYNKLNKFEEALPYLFEGEKYAIQAQNDDWRLNAYGNIVDSYDGLKDYKNESKFLFKYIELNDSLYNKEKSAQIIDMQTKYDTELKENENKLLVQQNQIQQLQISRSNYFIAGISLVLLSVIAIALLFIRQSKLNSQQRTMQLEQKLLRSQMNPHFIFNSLIAIESYIYKNEPKEAGRYLSNFAKLMRLILENSREEYIPLSKEIKTLEYYLQLQKNRFDDNFEYAIEVADNIDPDAIGIPPMLAQPFIENSIEHGLKNADKKGEIRILFRLQNDQLVFEVRDNGIGLEKAMAIKDENKEHTSIATVITKERLSALNRRKRKKIRLLIDELKDSLNNVLGTQVSFSIPFKEI
jgi:tetratricopeptide (TPR) repeat protein